MSPRLSVATLLLLAALGAPLAAQESSSSAPSSATPASAQPPEPEPSAETPDTEPTAPAAPLTSAELGNAFRIDTLTIPGPGELMAALNKGSRPNWQNEYREPIPTTFSSRAQIALNVGGLIADGYIALEAEDSQQVKNIGKDIITLAKSLAVSDSVIARGNSIIDFAENNEWSALKEELEATQNEVKLALEQQHDGDLVWLVSLGGWIRGTDAVSGWIANNYTPDAARLLRQPAIISLMRERMKTLPDKVQADPLVENVTRKLDNLETLVSFPPDAAPTLDDVKKLKEATSDLVEEISKKEAK
ncbi:MAG TPA: hypothetical protein VNQ90_19210 [Chthoniobacteraceae bacterium]|nr:hypothetical protein [Chthoniobacteraceae bacterium]